MECFYTTAKVLRKLKQLFGPVNAIFELLLHLVNTGEHCMDVHRYSHNFDCFYCIQNL